MKIDRRLKRTVEKMVVASFDKRGKILEDNVKSYSKVLRALPNSSAILALSYFLAGIKRGVGRTTLEIESAVVLSEVEIKKIVDLVSAQSPVFQVNTNLNHQLLGGLRVKIGDFVFDDSINARINQLKGAIDG